MPIIATAENYSIALEGMRAVVKVWKRPDIDAATGAARAAELVAHVRALTVDRARSVLLDLNAAPPVAGPKTTEVLADLLRTCERAEIPVAFVYGPDAVQALQCRRLVVEHAPKNGRAVRDLAEAEAFLGTRAPPPVAPKK